ncbi:acyl-CoA dehydrogenase C-terminal domain-containing protein [Novosphingobium sp. KACC 22771]|uniref:acyl-CoA dehydrogenase C-terminal domain-containing protein n=1 Tax=Novosphingobium sp. KACC 22771 TaxID=3025670 RepID=UPI00236561C2|nr:acyl-CoA dehydrogenase C-terminal domain-containing protein [Novosphingobium sp. KACC 22771]WDF73182.1 acyl-CoA dehydrogenase C-terminal domain-containing protein [Novosphingobium sp. KACC 22771]
MQVYTAPLRDMRFVLNELHQDDGFGGLSVHEEFTPDLTDAVLEEAAKICQDVLLPINLSGDSEGCQYENGVVRTPKGFKEAYDQFVQGGWGGLVMPVEYGGQGLPEAVGKLVEEMICATNVSFSLYPGLTAGAVTALAAYASDELKAAYLPKMISGEWSGTMNLTEPHCGTDLGLLRTKAEPVGQDKFGTSYKLTGSKIFISAGEQDLTSNIIHLVLARLPDAPKGVKGISLFLVPKFLPDADGNPGARNGVRASGIEHKMGIKASATCQMQFDDAIGWLVGQPHRGLEAMFTMMNAERVGVGIQGLGIGEAAYQSAVWYAKDRLQGRSLSGAKYPDKAADPIIVHPDVRKNLLTMRAYNEGCRALGAWVARGLDAERHATDPEVRQRAEDFVALMTPVVKALFTDLGHDSASLAVQVYGGHGYIHESGVEQYQRDARIAMIYEGTNGIQALDLVGRKMGAHMGRLLRSFFHPVSAFIEENKGEGPMQKMIEGLEKAFGALQLSTATIAEKGLKDPEEAGAAATDYLRLLGLVGMAYCFAKATKIAGLQIFFGAEDKAFYETKIKTATFFFEKILPQATTHFLAIKAGKGALMAFAEDEF